MFDWNKAEAHLTACEKVYAGIDTAGYLVYNYVICPLRARFINGERSEQLYKEIMATQL